MLAGTLLVAGCSLMGGGEAPKTTGSLAQPVKVERPLPPTLSYSDAAKIGEAASAALWQAEGAPAEWQNPRTGSSGTLQAESRASHLPECLPFSTTVTSLGGVHQYSATLCRGGDTPAVLTIAEAGSGDRS